VSVRNGAVSASGAPVTLHNMNFEYKKPGKNHKHSVDFLPGLKRIARYNYSTTPSL
jgi:hypothetical protein